jgi:hypothetical protein
VCVVGRCGVGCVYRGQAQASYAEEKQRAEDAVERAQQATAAAQAAQEAAAHEAEELRAAEQEAGACVRARLLVHFSRARTPLPSLPIPVVHT